MTSVLLQVNSVHANQEDWVFHGARVPLAGCVGKGRLLNSKVQLTNQIRTDTDWCK